jgi:hypothetical protein
MMDLLIIAFCSENVLDQIAMRIHLRYDSPARENIGVSPGNA